MTRVSKRFLRFIVVGIMATGVHVTTMVSLIELAGWRPVPASAVAFLLATLAGFVANRRWTFNALFSPHRQLIRYFFVASLGLSLNVGITYVVVDILGLWYGIALAIVVTAVPAITFVLNREWTFSPIT